RLVPEAVTVVAPPIVNVEPLPMKLLTIASLLTSALVLVTPINAPAEPVASTNAVSLPEISGVLALTDSDAAVICTAPEPELLGSPRAAITVGVSDTVVNDAPTASPPAATPNMSASAAILLIADTETAPLAETCAVDPM